MRAGPYQERTLTSHPAANDLSDKRYIAVCLRLLINGKRQLVYGEIVGARDSPGRRFVDWKGLTVAIQASLTHEG